MSIDRRTRCYKDIRDLSRDEVFDVMLPDWIERNGELAGRGLAYKELPSLALEDDGRAITFFERDGKLIVEEGDAHAEAVASLEAGALSELVQDQRTTMGLAMMAQVKMTRGRLDAFIGWEPIFRALVDARRVHEAGDVTMQDRNGQPLDLDRSFHLDDDRDEIAHFLHEAGFLHIKGVFKREEMAAVASDIDEALSQAQPDDGLSWWAGDSKGVQMPVRILSFHDRSAVLRELLKDERLTWLGDLPGDSHIPPTGAEGLIKPLDIRTGLSDLPWHKDCGQGSHSYMCCSMTVGISVTGADDQSGALGVVPGSHRASLPAAGLDPTLDLEPRKLPTATGDLTVHCSDTFHRAHHPTERPRKVVYTGFRLPKIAGDVLPDVPISKLKADRARLTNVRDRIAASGGDT
jgi:hypothetical protein